MLQSFLLQELPQVEADAYARHLNECVACQAVAESSLSLPAWSQDLLWFPDQLGPSAVPSRASGAAPELTSSECSAPPPSDASAMPLVQSGATRILAGRFELRRTIGMGGCGAVYEAWDHQLRRDVAIKVPHWTLIENPKVQQRFAVEARAAARLTHPNIVSVYEAVIDSAENSFLVSELVRGPSLETWLDERSAADRPVDLREAAAIVAEIADGIEFAHHAGVLHRDLKPSNILLAPLSTRGLPFAPRIADFGLARLSEEVTITTVEGSVCGTLPYLSPEQAVGRSPVGPACDIYALGVILYQLLTRTLPISAATPAALIAAISSQPVESPRNRRSEVPADLEAVCLKCLEKRPQDRYRTAAELALDLRRYLSGEAVSARLPGRAEQAARWIRRNPASSAVVATLVVAVLTILGVLAAANRSQFALINDLKRSDHRHEVSNLELQKALTTAEMHRIQASQARRLADGERRRTQEGLYVSEFQRAMRAWHDKDLPEVERILNRLDRPQFTDFRGIECDLLRTRLTRPHRELMRFDRDVYALAFSPDGEILAAAGRDSLVKQVRYRDGAAVSEWDTGQGEINGLAFVPGHNLLWTTGDDGTLCQWDPATQQELLRISGHAPEQAHDLLLIPQHDLLVSTGTDGTVRLWNPATGESRGELPCDGQIMIEVCLHPDGAHLYGISRSSIVRWRLEDRSAVDVWPVSDVRPLTMILVDEGRCLLVARNDGCLELMDSSNCARLAQSFAPTAIRKLVRLSSEVAACAVDAAGTLHELRLKRDATLPGPILEHRGLSRLFHGRPFQTIASFDGRDLVTADSIGGVIAWSGLLMNPQSPTLFLPDQIRDNHVFRFSPDLRSGIYAAGGTVHQLDLDRREVRRVVDISPRAITKVELLPNDEFLTGEHDPDLTGWLVQRRTSDGRPVRAWPIGSTRGGVGEIRVEPGLNLAFVGHTSQDSISLRIFSLNCLEEQRPLILKRITNTPAMNAIDSCFAISDNSWVEVRDTTSRTSLWTEKLPAEVSGVQCSRNGRVLVAACKDRVIRAWEARSGLPISEMSGHRNQVTSIAISSDGRTLFSADSDGLHGEVRTWHVSTGDLLGTLEPEPATAVINIFLSVENDRLLVRNRLAQLSIEAIEQRPQR